MDKIKIIINHQYTENPQLKDFLKKLPDIFDKEGIVLYDKRNTIKSYTVDKSDKLLKEVVVKRYKKPSFIQSIIYSFFRKSKAERAFYNAMELSKRGIDTPSPVAYIEQKENFLLRYGYYISSADNALPIREKLIEPEKFDEKMAEDFAIFAAQLHQKGILHHDLNSTNVLYHFQDNAYTFSVIDINRMDFYTDEKVPSQDECFKNMVRFTGRMDLYEYVLHKYIEIRGWDVKMLLPIAVAVKKHHDEKWKRRKAFFRRFKTKK